MVDSGLNIPFSKEVVQHNVPKNTLSKFENQEMANAIQKLIDLGAIEKREPTIDQFISKIFLAPKSNGGKRFILNLKPLNKFISKSHFKMEDFRTASKLIPLNGYLSTIDLKEAYLLIPIALSDRKYLRFQYEDSSGNLITYEFTSMPYGLSVAPLVFTKVMREVVAFLRGRGYQSVIYLDDILCIGSDYESCMENVNETLKLLQCLGFIVNYKKSCLKPQQICTFLGFNFNTKNLTISLPSEKQNNIAQLLKKFSKLPSCTIRQFAQLIGVLIAACPAVKYGWAHTKILERQKYLALSKNDNDYEAKITPPVVILDDINWWTQNLHHSFNPMRYNKFKLEIYTDASRTGWGAVYEDNRAHGHWKPCEQNLHINRLELIAAFLGLKCFAQNERNCTILLRIDNTTAISYINRMGGIQFPHLNEVARDIWRWCEERNIWIFASYVNTKDNVADAASRFINPDTEWTLSQNAIQIIVQHFGQPDTDLFATRTNAKCAKFVSWKQDPDAIAVDAFTIDWQNINFYAFPPFSLLLKCIRKIIDDKANGVLVFPHWPSQPWYPLLQSILLSNIVFLPPSTYLLTSPFRTRHPLQANLTLGVARLCGALSSGEDTHLNP